MPIIKQAVKKMRHDKKVTKKNRNTKETLKDAIKETRKSSSVEKLKKVYSLLDKAAKQKFIHKNKASRLKSRLAKAVAKKTK